MNLRIQMRSQLCSRHCCSAANFPEVAGAWNFGTFLVQVPLDVGQRNLLPAPLTTVSTLNICKRLQNKCFNNIGLS